MRLRILLSAAAASGLALSGAAAQENSGRPYDVTMTGAAERPGPGDTDGTGTASFRVNAGQNQVCYTLNVSNTPPSRRARYAGSWAGKPRLLLDFLGPAARPTR